MIEIVIPGPPAHKGRPRFRVITPRNGGKPFAQVYTDTKTQKAEAWVQKHALKIVAGDMPLEGPLVVEIHAAFAIRSSWPAWKREAAEAGAIWHTSRPDADNVAKLVLDAINGLDIWRDDAQVVELRCRKVYSVCPRTVVSIRQLEQPGSAREWKGARDVGGGG